MQGHADVFEMTPPHLLQGGKGYFFGGSAERHLDVSPEIRERMVRWCRSQLEQRHDAAFVDRFCAAFPSYL